MIWIWSYSITETEEADRLELEYKIFLNKYSHGN